MVNYLMQNCSLQILYFVLYMHVIMHHTPYILIGLYIWKQIPYILVGLYVVGAAPTTSSFST